ncbi:MAG TPA: SLBB domain-containing protein [Rubricoccaceae bacterium]|jgi:hypothetical protein
MTARLSTLAVLLAAVVASAAPTAAQTLRPTDERVSTAPGYFTYVLPGERTSQVTVLGTVRAPGLYLVSNGTNLGELIGLAGGTEAGARSSEVERTVTIRLFRAGASGTREVIYERTDDAFARDADGYPVVLDGDTVEVRTVERRLRTVRDTLTLVGGIATVVIAVVQIVTVLQ